MAELLLILLLIACVGLAVLWRMLQDSRRLVLSLRDDLSMAQALRNSGGGGGPQEPL